MDKAAKCSLFFGGIPAIWHWIPKKPEGTRPKNRKKTLQILEAKNSKSWKRNAPNFGTKILQILEMKYSKSWKRNPSKTGNGIRQKLETKSVKNWKQKASKVGNAPLQSDENVLSKLALI